MHEIQVRCDIGVLEAEATKITFIPDEGGASAQEFQLENIRRVYLLRDRFGALSIVINSKETIQTFDGCESVEAGRRFLEYLKGKQVVTEESGFDLTLELRPPPTVTAPLEFRPMAPGLAPRRRRQAFPPYVQADPWGGIAIALGVALLGSGIWAGIGYVANFRFSLIGVATGVGIGYGFRRFRLLGMKYASLASLLAIGSCLLGDIGGSVLTLAAHFHVGVGFVIRHVPLTLLVQFNGQDALFYGLSVLAAFEIVHRTRLTPGPGSDPNTLNQKGLHGVGRSLALASPVVVVLAVAGSLLVSNQVRPVASSGGTASQYFQVGTCVVGTATSTSIRSVACSENHNAIIDPETKSSPFTCPAGDHWFAAVAPNPSLCLNFGNHRP